MGDLMRLAKNPNSNKIRNKRRLACLLKQTMVVAEGVPEKEDIQEKERESCVWRRKRGESNVLSHLR